MDIYINSAQAISPQLTFQQENFLEEIREYNSFMTCILPNFKEFFDMMLLRRMSKILKISNAAAHVCLNEANVETPDAIITGTGLGCIEDTEKFLNKMLDSNEGLLNPTTFIQSTHNTLGAQIAVARKCKNYNVTYVHKTLSFEWALMDSIMLIHEGEAENVLVGGIDEITAENYELKKNIDLWKKEPYSNLEILNSNTEGTIPGEGATYFLISKKQNPNSYVRLDAVNIKYKTKNIDEIKTFIQSTIDSSKINTQDIDLVLYGINGDKNNDEVYYELQNSMFKNTNKGYFKHLSGEYDTASAFAMWLSAQMLKRRTVPEIIKIEKKEISPKRILIYNQEQNRNHSVIILSAC